MEVGGYPRAQGAEADFLTQVYDALVVIRAENGRLEQDPAPPSGPEWWWVLHGDRDRWWLEVHDTSISAKQWGPYILDPVGDPSFFAAVSGDVAPPLIVSEASMNEFLIGLWTAMDEHCLGHTEALRAYRQRSRTDPTIPWIHTERAEYGKFTL